MKKTDWKGIAELVGIGAIVASLVFLGLQMQQTQQIAWNDYRLNRLESALEAESTRYQYVDIWLKGNAGENLHDDEREIYQGLLDSKWDQAFWNTVAQRELGLTLDIDIHDFAVFLYQNPGARDFWLRARQQRNDGRTFLIGQPPSGAMDIQQIVLDDLEKMDQLNSE